MSFRTLVRRTVVIALAAAAPVYAQSGLRLPERSEPGIDPGFARGWLAPEFDRFGFASYQALGMGFAPPQRMHWSYSFGERTSLGLSVNGRDYDYDPRAVSVRQRLGGERREPVARAHGAAAAAGLPHRRPAPVLSTSPG
jgi:hypothetical protein